MEFQKVGIIGDVHVQHHTLKSALTFLGTQNVEAVLCTGDIADGPLAEPGGIDFCCDLLNAANVLVVKGNHDRWLLSGKARDWPNATSLKAVSDETLAYLRDLPKALPLQTSAGLLWLFHGVAENDLRLLKPEELENVGSDDIDMQAILQGGYSVVIAGHTHARLVARVGNLVCINAGTLCPGFAPCISVADFCSGSIQYWNYIGHGWSEAEKFSLVGEDFLQNRS